MKRYILLISNLVSCLVISAGFVLLLYKDIRSYQILPEIYLINIYGYSFKEQIAYDIVIMLILILVCTLVTTLIFINYKKHIFTVANTDELTGLANKKLFSKQYKTFVRRCKGKESTIFMLDIDYFKNINDQNGHLFGNEILKMVGDELRNTIRERGIAARWGGDEFLGAISVGIEEAEQILRQFMDALRNEENICHCSITVSIGIARSNGMPINEKMICGIDRALYRSKNKGRDCITIWEL